MHRSLVIDAVEMGLFQRRPRKGELIFHSDRGSQYPAMVVVPFRVSLIRR
jgi:transposase InsO family protein